MNTKVVMTASAIVLGATGIFLTFAPDVALDNLGIESSTPALLLVQIIGGLYFGNAMLNWMSKGNLIGGIYNRPVAVANFTHFMIAGLAIVKAVLSNPALPKTLWTAGVIYVVLGVAFGVILFRHPVSGGGQT
jgi:hypothetical protein